MRSFFGIVLGALFTACGCVALWWNRTGLTTPLLGFISACILLGVAFMAPADATQAAGVVKQLAAAFVSVFSSGKKDGGA